MIWRNIEYGLPEAAFLLFAILLFLGAFLALFRYRKIKLDQFIRPPLRQSIVEERLALPFWVKTFMYCLAWAAAVIALMQPQGSSGFTQNTTSLRAQIKNLNDIIILMDVSASMQTPDVRGNRTREETAKEIAEDIIRRLQGQNVALYAFTSQTLQIVPLTMDYLFTRLMLNSLQINESETAGTDIQQALEYVNNAFTRTSQGVPKTLILLSDGGDTLIESLQGDARQQAINKLIEPLKNEIEAGVQVFVVGLGSSAGADIPNISYKGQPVHSSIDIPLLKRIASASDGELFWTEETSPLAISRNIVSAIASKSSQGKGADIMQASDNGQKLYTYYFQRPLFISLLALTLFLLLPETRRRIAKGQPLLILIACIFIPSAGWSLTAQAMHESQIFYEAGDFPQAENLYEGWLDERLNSWQKGIIYYNIGTAALAQEKIPEALEALQTAAAEEQTPVLTEKLRLNIALARLMQAKMQMDDLLKNPQAKIEIYGDTIALLRQVLIDIDSAQASACTLTKIEGAATCIPSDTLGAMRLETKTLLATLLKHYQSFRMEQASLQEKIADLLTALHGFIEPWQFLSATSDRDLLAKYAVSYLQQAKSWMPLWDIIEQQMHKNDVNLSQELQAIFAHAKSAYLSAIQHIETGAYKPAVDEVTNSSAQLKILLQALLGDDAFKAQLQGLLVSYDFALVPDPIQEYALQNLLNEQNALEPIVQKMAEKSINDQYEAAQQSLTASLKNLNNNKNIQARMFASNARNDIRKLMYSLDQENPLPTEILTEALAEQRLALTLNRLRQQAQSKEAISTSAQQLPHALQTEVLQIIRTFYKSAIKQQIAEFQTSNGPTRNWAEAIPLVIEGQSAANIAEKILAGDIEERSAAEIWQEKAIENWEKALEKLSQPPKPASKASPSSSTPESSNEDKKEQLNQLLQQLQNMEEDDRSKADLKSAPVNKGVERPW